MHFSTFLCISQNFVYFSNFLCISLNFSAFLYISLNLSIFFCISLHFSAYHSISLHLSAFLSISLHFLHLSAFYILYLRKILRSVPSSYGRHFLIWCASFNRKISFSSLNFREGEAILPKCLSKGIVAQVSDNKSNISTLPKQHS